MGARVRVPSLGGARALVAKAPDERGRLKVTVGKVTVDVHVSELGDAAAAGGVRRPVWATARRSAWRRGGRAAGEGAGGRAGRDGAGGAQARRQRRPKTAWGGRFRRRANTLDLRGQRADEVRDAVEAYLDRAAMEDQIAGVHPARPRHGRAEEDGARVSGRVALRAAVGAGRQGPGRGRRHHRGAVTWRREPSCWPVTERPSGTAWAAGKARPTSRCRTWDATQARALGERLRGRASRRVYASHLVRARETAQIVAAHPGAAPHPGRRASA